MKIEGGNGLLSQLSQSTAQSEMMSARMKTLESSLNNYKNIKGEKGISTAAKGFESMFLLQMLQGMRKTVPQDGMFGMSNGEELFTSMMDEKIAGKMSDRGSFGIGSMITEYLEKQYKIENQSGPNNKNTTIPISSGKNINIRSLNDYRKLAGIDLNTGIADKDSDVVNGTSKNIISQNNPKNMSLSEKIANYEGIINEAAVKYEIDPDLIKAVIAKESSGNASAISKTGAKGLMQLMDGTAGDMGVKNVFDPRENIFGGARYLKMQLKANNGDLERALAAYNAGPSVVKLYDGVPPYTETKNYIQKVMGMQKQFRSGEI